MSLLICYICQNVYDGPVIKRLFSTLYFVLDLWLQVQCDVGDMMCKLNYQLFNPLFSRGYDLIE